MKRAAAIIAAVERVEAEVTSNLVQMITPSAITLIVRGSNTGTTVWADSAYRSSANETFMERHGFRSQILHRKPKGRPMPPHIRRGNATRSSVRAAIEHVFAHQKGPMALCIRTIGIARARVKIGLANLTYNIRRLIHHERIAAKA
jgi:IS5 family transposase